MIRKLAENLLWGVESVSVSVSEKSSIIENDMSSWEKNRVITVWRFVWQPFKDDFIIVWLVELTGGSRTLSWSLALPPPLRPSPHYIEISSPCTREWVTRRFSGAASFRLCCSWFNWGCISLENCKNSNIEQFLSLLNTQLFRRLKLSLFSDLLKLVRF